MFIPTIDEEKRLDDWTRRTARALAQRRILTPLPTQVLWYGMWAAWAFMIVGFYIEWIPSRVVAVTAPFVVGPVFAVFVLRGSRHREVLRGAISEIDEPICVACGYPLGDLPEDVPACPECGRANETPRRTRDVFVSDIGRGRVRWFRPLLPRLTEYAALPASTRRELGVHASERMSRFGVILCVAGVVAVLAGLFVFTRVRPGQPAFILTFLGVCMLGEAATPWLFRRRFRREALYAWSERCRHVCPTCGVLYPRGSNGGGDVAATPVCPDCGPVVFAPAADDLDREVGVSREGIRGTGGGHGGGRGGDGGADLPGA